MSEPKYRYRIPPCAKYDIAGMESWLDDQARQGLFLDRDGLFLGFATFAEGEPVQLRFRLEATDTPGGLFSPTHDPGDEIIELHQLMGWDYRGRWGQFHIYTTPDPDAPELHTDPRVQALTIQALNKFQRTELFGFFWYTLVWYLCHGFMLFSLTALWGMGRTLLLLGFLLSFPVVKFIGLVRMMGLKRRLKQGIPMEHRSDWFRGRWIVWGSRILRWVVGIGLTLTLLSLWGQDITEENTVSMADWNSPLPFATAQDLYPEAEVIPDDSFIGNDVVFRSSWIVPEFYEYTEWSDITFPDGTHSSIYLRVWYYDCRFEWFARGLARELANQNAGVVFDRWFAGSTAPEHLEGVDADYAVRFYHNNPGIAICDGTRVYLIRYSREVNPYFTPEELAQIYLDSIR